MMADNTRTPEPLFTASNGVTLDERGRYVDGPSYPITDREHHVARVEFYRHVEDERLGRWRWPDDPRYVVYPLDKDTVIVLNEETGLSEPHARINHGVDASIPSRRAADAYFAAHPVKQPWHDAQPGEFWSVSYSDTTEMCRVDLVDGHRRFIGVEKEEPHVTMSITHGSITHAVRFVAEGSA